MSVDVASGGKAERPRPVIDANECKSCGRCIAACPKKCLRLAGRLNRRGVRPAEYMGEGCTEPYVIVIEKQ
jgi:formate hydrogenlyase subunit 6/NADH:ubiquinone oxidoreductase subunit I